MVKPNTNLGTTCRGWSALMWCVLSLAMLSCWDCAQSLPPRHENNEGEERTGSTQDASSVGADAKEQASESARELGFERRPELETAKDKQTPPKATKALSTEVPKSCQGACRGFLIHWSLSKGFSYAPVLSDMKTDRQDNVYVLGHVRGDLSTNVQKFPSPFQDFERYAFVAKVSKAGKILWVRRFNWGLGAKLQICGESLVFTMRVGETLSFGDGSQMKGKAKSNIAVLKYKLDGTKIWAKLFGSASKATPLGSLGCDQNGRIYLSGEFEQDLWVGTKKYSLSPVLCPSGSVNKWCADKRTFLLALRQDGTPRWLRQSLFELSVREPQITVFRDGRYLVGERFDLKEPDKKYLLYEIYSKKDALLWKFRYKNQSESSYKSELKFSELEGGELLVVGSFLSRTRVFGRDLVAGADSMLGFDGKRGAFFVACIDRSLNLKWVHLLEFVTNKPREVWFNSLDIALDYNEKGFYISGYTSPNLRFKGKIFQTGYQRSSFYWMKVNSDGVPLWHRALPYKEGYQYPGAYFFQKSQSRHGYAAGWAPVSESNKAPYYFPPHPPYLPAKALKRFGFLWKLPEPWFKP